MATINQIYAKKETRGNIVVNKGFNIPLDQLYIEEGFNVRDLDADHVLSIAQAYASGQTLPHLVVQPQDDGRMKIVDGAHRYTSAHYANDELGADIIRLPCVNFTGSVSDQLAFMITSSQGRNLSPVERGKAYARLFAFGHTRTEIAEKLNRSLADVDHHLCIATLPDVIHQQISDGSISPTLAVELYNKKGKEGVTDAINQAKASGKKKATRANTSLWKPKMGKTVVSLLSSVTAEDYIADGDENVQVSMSREAWDVLQEAIKALGDEQ